MVKKELSKIISLISALALILGCFAGTFVSVTAETEALDFQALAVAANLEISNETTQADLDTAFAGIQLPDGYTYEGITEYYMVKAYNGAIERGSLYDNAPTEDVVLVPGEEGSVAALVAISNGTVTETQTVVLTVEPKMEVYQFSSISNSMDDWTGSNSTGYKYTGGWVDKLVIPDEITALGSDWHNWQHATCTVYPKNMKSITRCCFNQSTIAVLPEGVTTIDNLAFYQAVSLKYIRLPDTVTTIGEQSFLNCKSLEQLNIPDSVSMISANVFAETPAKAVSGDHVYNLTELTIPAGLDNVYSPTFAGAQKDIVITFLSRTDKPGWSVFYDDNEDNKAAFEHITVRAHGDSTCYRYFYSVNPIIDLDSTLTLTEAIARAYLKLDELNSTFYPSSEAIMAESDQIRSTIASAYYNVTGITSSWKNASWEYNSDLWTNYLVLDKNGETAELKIQLPAALDLTPYVKDLTVSNDTDQETLQTMINSKMPDGITATVVEFYKLPAENGAIEKGSTYNGAVDGTVLSPGEDGYVNAKIEAVSGGKTVSTRVSLTIKAQMEEFAFTSCSSSADWTITNGVGTYNGGNNYEKVIIPDEVTSLGSDWSAWKGNIKCLVVGTGITTLPRNLGLSGLKVVSFKEGSNLTTIGNLAFYGANNLKYIHLPDTVTIIGAEAFRLNTAMTYLYLPEGIDRIDSNLFCKPDDTSEHNLTYIEIPSTVTWMGGGSFNGAAGDCEVVVLTKTQNFWSSGYFYSDTYPERGTGVIVRCWTDTRQATPDTAFTTVAPHQHLEDMTFSEVVCRAQRAANRIGSKVSFDSASALAAVADDYLIDIAKSYGSLSSITLSWKDSWKEDSGFLFNNTLVITDGTETANVAFFANKNVDFDLQSIIENSDITIDNNTTEASLIADLTANGFADYEISMVDFYNLHSFNGAIERGSTYENAPTEDVVLVESKDGYLSAIVSVKGANGHAVISKIFFEIKAVPAIYSFESCSTVDDWDITDGVGEYFGSAEKIVIPDEVTSLPNNWIQWESNTRCIVYGTGLTSTPRMYGISNLEVVSFKGNNITTLGDLSFWNCKNLKYIRMPDSITWIGGEVFYGNTAMEQLYISEGTIRINNSPMFFKPSDSGTHNITQFIIPASVDYIVADAFCGAGKPCEVTILTTSNNLWNTNVFYSADYPARGKNYTLRVYHSANQASADQRYATYSPKKYIENMGVCEAYVRATRTAKEIVGTTYESDAVAMIKITNSYFGVAGIKAEWKNDFWIEDGAYITNSVVLTKGDYSYEVPLSLCAKTGFYASGASILNAVEFENNNSKQGLHFTFKYSSDAANTFELDGKNYTVSEVGVIIKHISNSSLEYSAISDDDFVIGAADTNSYVAVDGIDFNTESGVNTYSAYIKNIPQGGRDYLFQVRGYVKYTDDGGQEQIAYSDSNFASAKSVYSIYAADANYSAMDKWFAETLND